MPFPLLFVINGHILQIIPKYFNSLLWKISPYMSFQTHLLINTSFSSGFICKKKCHWWFHWQLNNCAFWLDESKVFWVLRAQYLNWAIIEQLTRCTCKRSQGLSWVLFSLYTTTLQYISQPQWKLMKSNTKLIVHSISLLNFLGGILFSIFFSNSSSTFSSWNHYDDDHHHHRQFYCSKRRYFKQRVWNDTITI